jgi:two-component system chemotaxis sensor kinase CheA
MDFTVFKGFPLPIVVCDNDKKIAYVNDEFCQLIGQERASVEKKILIDILNSGAEDDKSFLSKNAWDKNNESKEFIVTCQFNNKTKQIRIKTLSAPHYGQPYWPSIISVHENESDSEKVKQQNIEMQKCLEKIKEMELINEKNQEVIKRRTNEILESNKVVNLMINSIDVGLITFNAQGICMAGASRASELIFKINPVGKQIADVLQLKASDEAVFKQWIEMLFSEPLPFNELLDIGIKNLVINERFIEMSYSPLRGEDGKITAVAMSAYDKTSENEAKRLAKKNQEMANMFVKVSKNKDSFKMFIKETRHMIAEISKELLNEKDANIELLMRLLHSIKGSSNIYSFLEISELTHEIEGSLAPLQFDSSPEKIRAIFPQLQQDIRLLNAQFEKHTKEVCALLEISLIEGKARHEVDRNELFLYYDSLDKYPALKKDFREKFILTPVKNLIGVYNSAILETAQKLGKKVLPLKIDGGETKVDTTKLAPLMTNLIHAFRNSVDHGLEFPHERRELGKKEEGLIQINIKRKESEDGNYLSIVISDDGRGINTARLKEKLLEQGQSAEALSEFEIHQRIFDDNLSTAEAITDLSGRGVGMSAIKEAVEQLGGKIWVESRHSEGTQTYIKIPTID